MPPPGAAMLDGEKIAVTPAGNPVAERVTEDLNPFDPAVVMLKEAELPPVTVALVALRVRVRLGITTATPIVAARVNPPPVPLIVTVELLAVAVLAAMNVAVTGELEEMVVEENFTVTPAGNPVALSVGCELNAPCGTIVIVAELDVPGAIEMLETFGASVKFTCPASLQ